MGNAQKVQLYEMYEIHQCGECGISFAVPVSVIQRWRDEGSTWYCPNGHSRVFSESTIDQLEKENKRLQKEKEWAEQDTCIAKAEAEHAEYRRRAQKAVNTKIKKRIGNGVCPCCNRTFKNLGRHMKTKHPKYKGK